MKKSTKTIISVLIFVLIIFAGLLVWGILSGRISSLADLVAGPGESILIGHEKGDFLKGGFNNTYLSDEKVEISKLDPEYQYISDPVKIETPKSKKYALYQSIFSYNGYLYVVGGIPFDTTAGYETHVATNAIYYGKVKSDGIVEDWKETYLSEPISLTYPVRFQSRICFHNGVDQALTSTLAGLNLFTLCGTIQDDGTISNFKKNEHKQVSLTNSGSDFYYSERETCPDKPDYVPAVSHYVFNMNNEMALKQTYGEPIEAPLDYPCEDIGIRYYEIERSQTLIFKNIFALPKAPLVGPPYFFQRTIENDGALSEISDNDFSDTSIDLCVATRSIGEFLPSCPDQSGKPTILVQTENGRFLFSLKKETDEENIQNSVLYSYKINDSENSGNFDDLGYFDGVFDLGEEKGIKNFIWSGTTENVGILESRNGNANTNDNSFLGTYLLDGLIGKASAQTETTNISVIGKLTDSGGNLIEEGKLGIRKVGTTTIVASAFPGSELKHDSASDADYNFRFTPFENSKCDDETCEIYFLEKPTGFAEINNVTFKTADLSDSELFCNSDETLCTYIRNVIAQASSTDGGALKFKIRTAGADGVWSDWSEYSSSGTMSINDNLRYVEYQGMLTSNGENSPYFDGVALTSDGGKIKDPDSTPAPGPDGSNLILTSGTLPRTGSPFGVWMLVAVVVGLVVYLSYLVVKR